MKAGDPIRTPVDAQLFSSTGGSEGRSTMLRVTDRRSGLVVLEVPMTASQLRDMLASSSQHPQPIATIYTNTDQLGKHVVTASRDVAIEPGDHAYDRTEDRYGEPVWGERIERLLAEGPTADDVRQGPYSGARFAELEWHEGTASVRGGGGRMIGLLWRTYVECEGEGCPHAAHDHDYLVDDRDADELRARVRELETELAAAEDAIRQGATSNARS